MANRIYKDESGKILEVKTDEHVLDPNSPLAVQIPPAADGTNEHPLGTAVEDSPNEVFGDEGSAPAPAAE